MTTLTTTRKISTFAALAAALLMTALLPATAWAEDSPGTIEFKANNKLYNAHGKFEKWKFTRVTVPGGNLEKGSVDIEIQLSSVWEKTAALADHLRQDDFFNVEKFSTATIKIDRVKKTGDDTYTGTAAIDFLGHTGEVPVNFKVVGTSPIKIEGDAVMKRTDFGLGEPYDPSNDRSIVDDVEVMISATLP
ncbi:MAG: YceI family protein [Acidobacteriota bacterium]